MGSTRVDKQAAEALKQALTLTEVAELIAEYNDYPTYRDMAKAIGLSLATWQRLLAGTSHPAEQTFRVVATYLQTLDPPLSYVITDETEKQSTYPVPTQWETLVELDKLARASHGMTRADVLAELEEINIRQARLIKILAELDSQEDQD